MSGTKNTIISEEEIISLLREKNEKAVLYLYDHYSKALFGLVFRIVQDQEIAEELLQETFVKIWVNISTYDENKGRLYTWMLNIARNLAIDKLRSREYKEASKTQTLEKSVDNINKNFNTSFNQDTIGLKALTDKLRPEQKELIDLVYFYGYSQAEAAEKLKMPLGTVKTRIRSAIGELRTYFKNTGQ